MIDGCPSNACFRDELDRLAFYAPATDHSELPRDYRQYQVPVPVKEQLERHELVGPTTTVGTSVVECKTVLGVAAESAGPYAAVHNAIHMKSHIRFLNEIVAAQLVSTEVANVAKSAWWQLFVASDGSLPFPAASTGPDGQLMYYWNAGHHHLELEFTSGESPEFYYRNFSTGESWERVFATEDDLQQTEIAEKLGLFRSSCHSA